MEQHVAVVEAKMAFRDKLIWAVEGMVLMHTENFRSFFLYFVSSLFLPYFLCFVY